MKCKHSWKEVLNKEKEITIRDERWDWHREDNTRAVISKQETKGTQCIFILTCAKCGEINKTITQETDRIRW